MDTREGRFEHITEEQARKLEESKAVKVQNTVYRNMPVFHVGQRVQIKTSIFEVEKITSKRMTLRVLPSTAARRRP